MSNATALRWIAIALHGIVMVYAVLVLGAVMGWDFAQMGATPGTDPNSKRLLWLSALLIGGNALAIVLLLTPLFSSFFGSCMLVLYEAIFLATSVLWLALEYSIVIAIIAAGLIYVAVVRRKEGKNIGRPAQVAK